MKAHRFLLLVILSFLSASIARGQSVSSNAREPANNSSVGSSPYHAIKTISLAPYKRLTDAIAFDSASHRLFLCDGKNLLVIDAETGTAIGTVPKVEEVSQIVIAAQIGRGFALNAERQLIIFNLETLQPVTRIHAGNESVGFIYDSQTKQLFTIGAAGKTFKAFDATTGELRKTVKLDSYIRDAYGDANGHVYFELNHKMSDAPLPPGYLLSQLTPDLAAVGRIADEIAEIDTQTLQIINRWTEPSCQSMRVMGVDSARRRLVAACQDSIVLIDADSGRVVTSTGFSAGDPFNFKFDANLGDAFLSPFGLQPTRPLVLHEGPSDKIADAGYMAPEKLRDVAFDGQSGRFFVLKGDYRQVDLNAVSAAALMTGGGVFQALNPVPGSFRIIVYGKH